MVESTALRFLNKRIAALTQQYQARPARTEIAEELSELAAVRDQLKGMLESLVQRPKEAQISAEFPTLGAFVQRIDTLGRQIATTTTDNPQRHDLLNEMTSLCFTADVFCKREL